MKNISRDKILSIIREEFDINEMAGRGHEDPNWPFIDLPEVRVIDISDIRTPEDGEIESINPSLDSEHPDYNKKFKNIIFTKRLRVSPNNTVAAVFTNHAGGKSELMHYIFEGPNIENIRPKLRKYLPRSKKVGTSYTGPLCSMENESYAKRFWVYPSINNFFARTDIRSKLNSLGLPTITAGSSFTEPVTNKIRLMRYNGPEICFELHCVADFEDVSDVLQQIVSYREALARGETPEMTGTLPIVKQVRKYGGQIYKGGKWAQAQRVLTPEYFQETDILKLFMWAVQKGKIQYSVASDFEVMGEPSEDFTQYDLYLEFRFHRTYRNFEKNLNIKQVKGIKPEGILPPLKVKITKPIPPNADPETFGYKNNSGFFVGILREGLEVMSQKIMDIDPDLVLPKIDSSFFNMDDMDFE